MQLHMLCGIPGSGKSTLTQYLSGYVISTDAIRQFLLGDESVVTQDRFVINVAERMMDYHLGQGNSVIFDATNLTVKTRKKWIRLAKNHQAIVILHWVDCPLQTAIERNAKRDRHVPIPVIQSFHRSFQPPKTEEGIDVIKQYDSTLQLQTMISSSGDGLSGSFVNNNQMDRSIK
ncbi:hypothetical protein DCC39_09960 [Pueribacillus theae]|uniref:ATP-binding protein n=1 Tax=Pueribacillus theae TaxID=2171751 RepID=A0A2U1K2E2_9BACI|nr:ATP-binding protein [Pueribacillus theae]PWA11153.1 hypothetical protein DCC39_09960 [Pueribacillus theae]